MARGEGSEVAITKMGFHRHRCSIDGWSRTWARFARRSWLPFREFEKVYNKVVAGANEAGGLASASSSGP